MRRIRTKRLRRLVLAATLCTTQVALAQAGDPSFDRTPTLGMTRAF